MRFRRLREYIQKILLIFVLFVFGFGSKAGFIINLGKYDMIGPDPYLFYRYAWEIYNYGRILVPDCLRYYPLCAGIDSYPLVAYVGALNAKLMNFTTYSTFFKWLLSIFNFNTNLAGFDLAIHLVPPIMFGIATVIFYLLAKEILRDKIKALFSTGIFATIPAMIFRNLPFEKEPTSLPFILGAIYTYIKASKLEYTSKKKSIILYLISGILTAIASYAWGGWVFIPLVISMYQAIRILTEDVKPYFITFYIWIFSETYRFGITSLFSTRILISLGVIAFYFIDLIIRKKIESLKVTQKTSELLKIDKSKASKIIELVFLIIAGFIFISKKILYVLSNPWADRFGSSVAEQQPTDPSTYVSYTTPIGILAALLSINYILSRDLDKDKKISSATLSVAIFSLLSYLTLSLSKSAVYAGLIQYKTTLILLGLGSLILALYFGKDYSHQDWKDVAIPSSLSSLYLVVTVSSIHIVFSWMILAVIYGYYILKSMKMKKHSIEDSILLVTTLITFTIGAYINRLIYYVGYSIPLLIPYALKYLDLIDVEKDHKVQKATEALSVILLIAVGLSSIYVLKVLIPHWIIALGILPISAYIFYRFTLDKTISANRLLKYSLLSVLLFGIVTPTKAHSYNGMIKYYLAPTTVQGTEKYLIDALLWARDNTEPNAIFSHWWDYGYYVQTIANRTTWLDGGNQIVYWNHLMGRYGLCGNTTQALKLFYVHSDNGTRPTYYLIHPTDIGKMYQFSKLGSNSRYDLHSWISPVIFSDLADNATTIVYRSYTSVNGQIYSIPIRLDQDLIINGTRIPRCIPEAGIDYPNCGVIEEIDLHLRKRIAENKFVEEGNRREYKTVFHAISPFDIKSADIVVRYGTLSYKLSLGCVYLDGIKVTFSNASYNGCLYLTPSISLMQTKDYQNLSTIYYGYFITQKAMKFLWIRLYFFEDNIPYFKTVYDSLQARGVPSMIYHEIQPLKIWKVEYPKNLTVSSHEYCLYLAKNLDQINRCAIKYGKTFYRSIWDV